VRNSRNFAAAISLTEEVVVRLSGGACFVTRRRHFNGMLTCARDRKDVPMVKSACLFRWFRQVAHLPHCCRKIVIVCIVPDLVIRAVHDGHADDFDWLVRCRHIR
jgi:hypothetical protein